MTNLRSVEGLIRGSVAIVKAGLDMMILSLLFLSLLIGDVICEGPVKQKS